MLNSSYQDADLPSTENNSICVLRCEILRSKLSVNGALMWDWVIMYLGQPSSVSLQPEATGSSASTKATIEIEDAGPIVTVQQSDLDRDLASHQETMRMMSDSIRTQQTLSNATINLQSLRRY
jgi:hypothetical protein